MDKTCSVCGSSYGLGEDRAAGDSSCPVCGHLPVVDDTVRDTATLSGAVSRLLIASVGPASLACCIAPIAVLILGLIATIEVAREESAGLAMATFLMTLVSALLCFTVGLAVHLLSLMLKHETTPGAGRGVDRVRRSPAEGE